MLPPAWGPLVGLTPVTVGGGVVGVTCHWRVVAEVPLGVVTVTSTVPVPDGAMTVRVVEVVTLTEVPAVDPKSTGSRPDEAGAGDRDRVAAGLRARCSG